MNGQARSSLSIAPDEIYSARLISSDFFEEPFTIPCFLKSLCSLPALGADFFGVSMIVVMT